MTQNPVGAMPEPPRSPQTEALLAQARAKADRPWFKKKRWIAAMAFAAMAIVGAATSDPETTPVAAADDDSSSQTAQEAPVEDAVVEEDAAEEAAEEAVSEEPEEPDISASQANALRSAEEYLSVMPFSKKGLIEQLSSAAGNGYPRKDAVWAVRQLDVDWREQAVQAGRNYLDLMGFSRDGLIEQLSSDAGSGFTRAEAVHAADELGL